MRNLFMMLVVLVLLTIIATLGLYASWGSIDLAKVPLPPVAADASCDHSEDLNSERCSSSF